MIWKRYVKNWIETNGIKVSTNSIIEVKDECKLNNHFNVNKEVTLL
jgi:hypothetical protein